MSAIYNNWERLVTAALKKQQLWELFHDHSRTPSDLSSSRSRLSSPLDDDFHRSFPKLVFVSDFSPSVNVKHVRLASTQLLGRGTFGTTYAAKLADRSKLVVKRLNSKGISQNDFNRQMAIVAGVKHENVAALRAYYSSGDERLMVYDHYLMGSVYDLLHGRHGERVAPVDWGQRLGIAIGVARGISEIHKHGNLAHGNIKTTNVFLNPKGYSWVLSDLGPTNLVEMAFPLTGYCYAPEVKKSKNVSQASDVYSFGILLLELLTRKPTVQVHGGPLAVDLVKELVTSKLNKARAANVYDADLLKDPSLEEQMVEMLKIGIKCVAKSRKKRPKMSKVVNMIDFMISFWNLRTTPLKIHKYMSGMFIFHLETENFLRYSGEVPGKGTFETPYNTMLENGETVVKRLKDVIVTVEDSQEYILVLERMWHLENISEGSSEDEKLLVYDFFNQDLSSMMHGQRGAARTPLGWETRLKIAVGAARGIAHIDKQDDRMFVYDDENVKSSNIFASGQKYGIVSHAGLANVTRSIRLPSPRTLAYCAPEIMHTERASQASDVFGIGLLLLQLLSGKPTKFTGDGGGVTLLVEWVQSVDREEWVSKVFDSKLVRSEVEDETMIQIMLIARDCVSSNPDHRPNMSQVVERLEEIGGIRELSSLEDTWEQPLSMESRLVDLLDYLLVVLMTESDAA